MNTQQDRPDSDRQDWQLRAELRATDPARNLAPADAAWLAQVRADATATPRPPRRGLGGKTTGRRPSRQRILVGALSAAGALGVAAAVGLPTTRSATVLSAPPDGGPAAACAPVEVVGLQQADSAFRATVTSLDDGQVEATVTHRYKGEVSSTVQFPYQPDVPLEMSIGPLTVGQSVLITVRGTSVASCGLSGPDSPELTSLYDQAFGG